MCRSLAAADAADLEHVDLFVSRATNVILPLMKFCLYELHQMGGDVSRFKEIEKSLAISTDSDAGSIHFRDHDIRVQSKPLKVMLVKIQSLQRDYTDSHEEKDFLALFSVYDDAIAVVSADLTRYNEMKAGPGVGAKRQELGGILGFLKNAKLQLAMGRTEHRIEECDEENHRDLAHLFDTLLQDAKAVCSLPGPGEEEEDEFALEANANVLRVRAFRAYHISHLYASSGSPIEALSLLQKADLLTRRALEEIAACENLPHNDRLMEGLEHLSVEVQSSALRFKARHSLMKSNYNADILVDAEAFEARESLVDLRLDSMHAKPSFFDVAWNQINGFPSAQLGAHVASLKPKSRLLGWF